MQNNLHLLLRRLADAGLDFVVIGGYAGVLHGSALVTNDVDVCAVLSVENVKKIRAALTDIHPVQLSFLEHPAPDVPVLNLYLETDDGIIDILSNVLGVGDFERLKSKAEDYEIEGRIYRVISIEDLITAKEAVGRDKDRLAAKELRCILAKRR